MQGRYGISTGTFSITDEMHTSRQVGRINRRSSIHFCASLEERQTTDWDESVRESKRVLVD